MQKKRKISNSILCDDELANNMMNGELIIKTSNSGFMQNVKGKAKLLFSPKVYI